MTECGVEPEFINRKTIWRREEKVDDDKNMSTMELVVMTLQKKGAQSLQRWGVSEVGLMWVVLLIAHMTINFIGDHPIQGSTGRWGWFLVVFFCVLLQMTKWAGDHVDLRTQNSCFVA